MNEWRTIGSWADETNVSAMNVNMLQNQHLSLGHLTKRSFADTSAVCTAARRATSAAIENDTDDAVLDATHGAIVRVTNGRIVRNSGQWVSIGQGGAVAAATDAALRDA